MEVELRDIGLLHFRTSNMLLNSWIGHEADAQAEWRPEFRRPVHKTWY
jgi:hypothetical protein